MYLCRLRIACLPVLLHLHQSQLDFLIAFFGAKRSPRDGSQSSPRDTCSSDVISGKDNNAKVVSVAEEALLPFFQASSFVVLSIRLF